MRFRFRRSALAPAASVLLGPLFLAAPPISGVLNAQAARPIAAAETSPVVTEKVALRYVTPFQIVALIGATKTPPPAQPAKPGQGAVANGALALIVGGDNASLTLKGDVLAVANARRLIAILDKPARRVQVSLRLLRRSAPDLTNGAALTPSASDEVMQSSVRTITNNEPAALVVSRENAVWNVEARPHINGDNTVSVTLKLTRRLTDTVAPPQECGLEMYRRTPSGVPFRVTAFLDKARAETNDEGLRGLYILEVTPVIVKALAKTR